MKKNKMRLLIICSSLLVVGLISFMIIRKLFTPVLDISKALAKTVKQNELMSSTTISFSNIGFTFSDETLTPVQQEALDTFLTSTKFNIDYQRNYKEKRLQITLTLNMGERQSTAFSIYLDEYHIAFKAHEVSRQLLFASWSDFSRIIGLDYDLTDKIGAFLSGDNPDFLDELDAKEYYLIIKDYIKFDKKTNVKTQLYNDSHKVTRYSLNSSVNDIHNLLRKLLPKLLGENSLDTSLYNYLSDLNSNIDTLQLPKEMPYMSLSIYKNKLAAINLYGAYSFTNSLFDVAFEYNLKSLINEEKANPSWLEIDRTSIDLGSKSEDDLETFLRKYSYKLYTLCLKYPTLLELFGDFFLEW